MDVGSRCRPVGGQPARLSPIGAALTTGASVTGNYRFYIVPGQLMRKAGTVNAWIAQFRETVNAWITSAIHSFLG